MNDTHDPHAPAPLAVDDPSNVGVPKVDVDWSRAAAWWKPVTMTLPISWRLSHLLLSAVGVVLSGMYNRLTLQLFFTETPQLLPPSLNLTVPSPPHTVNIFDTFGDSSQSFLREWGRLLGPLLAWIANPTLQGAAYAVATLLGLIFIWGFIGGCLVRRSVVELGTGRVPSWNDSFRWVRQRARSIFWALTMPTCGVLMLCAIPFAAGLLVNIPAVGEWVAGLLMIPLSLVMLAIGWTAAITLFGFPMAIAAIVTEKKADAFDGISRSGAYLFQRPVLLLLLVAAFECISRLGGAVFTFIVQTGATLLNHAFAVGILSNAGWTTWQFTQVLPIVLAAFGLSYFWTAQAATYLLLRKSVDSAELDSVDTGDANT